MSDDHQGYPGAPPGWYADPAGGPGQRWWDGYAWTEATVLPAQPPPPPPPPSAWDPATVPPPPGGPPLYAGPGPASAQGLVSHEMSMFPAARMGYAVFGVYSLLVLVNTRLNVAQYRLQGHQLRLTMHAAQHQLPTPVFSSTPSTIGPLEDIGLLIALVAAIFACIWQFRAATSARALGWPASRSPGWGVVFWFIPIVSFWMPYQAIRDCLPPDDPNRPLVLRWWLLVIGGQLLTGIAVSTAFFSGAVSLALSFPAALVALGVMATGPRVVSAVASSHRAAVGQPDSGTAVTR